MKFLVQGLILVRLRRTGYVCSALTMKERIRMTKSIFARSLCLLAAGALLLGSAGTAHAQKNKQPNIVHIVADDLGWKDVGFNGATDIKTPNIDELATGGAKFEQFYSMNICTPSRACLMTGRYPFRYGLQTIVIPGPASYGLDTSEYLLPQVLKDAGYNTAIIGKWHLGHADTKYWPKQRGFDYAYGANIGEVDYFTHSDAGVLDWYRNNEPVIEEGYTTQLIGADAVKYINEQRADKPFYLYLTFNAPHTPYQAPQDYIDRFANIEDPTRRTYAGMIACLDDEIGRVVAALEKKKLRKNTLIIFHSDNGGTRNPMAAGQMADVTKIKLPCDNGPFREGKGTLFEGGSRVAAFANWPGKIKPGTVEGMVAGIDLLPTFATLAGASTAKCKPLDGMNVWETIAENKPSPRTEYIYNVEPFRAAVRPGEWKLIWRPLIPTSVDLFDLAKDPYETTNLAAAHPDKVKAMQDRLNTLGTEAAKSLGLIYITQTGLAHGTPVMGSIDGKGAVMVSPDGHSITDEAFGEREAQPDKK